MTAAEREVVHAQAARARIGQRAHQAQNRGAIDRHREPVSQLNTGPDGQGQSDPGQPREQWRGPAGVSRRESVHLFGECLDRAVPLRADERRTASRTGASWPVRSGNLPLLKQAPGRTRRRG